MQTLRFVVLAALWALTVVGTGEEDWIRALGSENAQTRFKAAREVREFKGTPSAKLLASLLDASGREVSKQAIWEEDVVGPLDWQAKRAAAETLAIVGKNQRSVAVFFAISGEHQTLWPARRDFMQNTSQELREVFVQTAIKVDAENLGSAAIFVINELDLPLSAAVASQALEAIGKKLLPAGRPDPTRGYLYMGDFAVLADIAAVLTQRYGTVPELANRAREAIAKTPILEGPPGPTDNTAVLLNDLARLLVALDPKSPATLETFKAVVRLANAKGRPDVRDRFMEATKSAKNGKWDSS